MTPGFSFASGRGFLVHLLLVGLVVGGCTCDEKDRRGDADVDGNVDLDGSTDAEVDGSSGGTCSAFGDVCGTGCCLGLACDVGTGRCALPSTVCAASGDDCTDGNDCCSLYCDGTSKCGTACVQNGQNCGADAECCTGNCNGSGQCANVVGYPGTCTSTGNACAVDANCCSNNCVGNVCQTTGAACAPVGDRCYGDTDCCSFKCNLSDATSPAGFCELLAVGGTSSCSVAGEPCNSLSCKDCCSRACAPTVAGATVCSNVSGCRVDGDICENDDDCCGGPNSGYGSAGSGDCVKNAPGDTYGRCQINQGPVGAVCSLVTPVCGGVSSAPSNCSDCASPKSQCCHIDSGGTPRCLASNGSCPGGFDGTAGCCIASGAACSNSSECCNGAPCLQDGSGTYRCGAACSAANEVCANTGDCCLGLTCIVPAGELTGTCTMPPSPTDPDAGVLDGGTPPVCAGYSQVCTATADCCPGMGLTCFDYNTNTACAGGTNCACLQILE